MARRRVRVAAGTAAPRSGAISRSRDAGSRRGTDREPVAVHANGRVVAAAASGSRACASTPSIHAAHLVGAARRPAMRVLEVVDQPLPAVVEHARRAARPCREVAVEGLVGQPRVAHDVADPGVDAAGAAHDRERGVEQPCGPRRRRPRAAGQRPRPARVERRRLCPRPRNGVLHSQNWIPVWRRSTSRVRWTWPVAGVRGSASTSLDPAGLLERRPGARRSGPAGRRARTARARRGTTTAQTTSPHCGSGTPDDRDLGHRRVVGEHRLDLDRRDRLAAGADDVADGGRRSTGSPRRRARRGRRCGTSRRRRAPPRSRRDRSK